MAIVAGAAFIGLALPAAAQAARNWAVVQANGTFVRGSGVATTTRLSLGTYLITFDARIAGCGFVANPGDPMTGAVADAAVAAVARRAGDPHGLSLQTYNETTHALADEPFHVAVYCGPTARFAVVGKGGALSHGSHALSARRIARGEYSVHFDSDVANCAFTAGVGSTRTTPVTAPGEISAAPGKKPHDVLVATTGAGGSPRNFPFHLAAACGTTPLRAVVTSGGVPVRGRNLVSSTHLGLGTYEVIFDQDIRQCAYTATVGSPAAAFSTLPLTISTASRAGNADGAFIFIHDAAGAAVDHAFHIVARC